MYAHCGSSLSLRSSHSHLHVACALLALLLISSTSPFTSSPFPHHLSYSLCCSCFPTSSTSLMSVDEYPAYFRWGPWHPNWEWLHHRLWAQRPLHHRGLCRIHPGVLGRAAVPLMTSTSMTSPSVRRSFMRAEHEPITLKKKARRPVCRRQSVKIRTVKPVVCRLVSSGAQETQNHNSENEQIRTLLDRQREQILADCQGEIRKHEFQADYDRSIQMLNETIESQKEEICRAHQGDERRRQDEQLLHEQLLKQNWDLREAHEKSLNEMEELKRFQGSTFDTIARRKLVEDRDTFLELTGKIQELQNEINCMNDSRDFQDAESVRQWTIPRFQSTSVFPTSSRSLWNAKPFFRNAEPQRWAAKHLGHTMVYRETFLQIQQRLLQHFIRKSRILGALMYQNTHHHMWWVKAKTPSQGRQPEIQSSLVREILQRIMGQTNNDCRFWIFISANSPHQLR